MKTGWVRKGCMGAKASSWFSHGTPWGPILSPPRWFHKAHFSPLIVYFSGETVGDHLWLYLDGDCSAPP